MKKEMRIETTTAMMTKTSIRTYMTTSTMKIVKIKYDFEIIGLFGGLSFNVWNPQLICHHGFNYRSELSAFTYPAQSTNHNENQ
ncbi:hypothetical protein HID58_074429 [Brassica napus]|uniref:Uncharacterized protein n=1 Tax=Brassica napus TaxID=3708 RepID=A0ABQ7YGX3_BRANA|nr:hypothetical protein HID58_074429 [Brassica napus]